MPAGSCPTLTSATHTLRHTEMGLVEFGLALTLIGSMVLVWFMSRLMVGHGRLLLRLGGIERGRTSGLPSSARSLPGDGANPSPALLSAERAFWSPTDPDDARYRIC